MHYASCARLFRPFRSGPFPPAFVPRHPAGPRASAFHCTFSTHTAKDAQKAKEDKEASDKEKHSDKNHSKHKQPLPSYTYASPGQVKQHASLTRLSGLVLSIGCCTSWILDKDERGGWDTCCESSRSCSFPCFRFWRLGALRSVGRFTGIDPERNFLLLACGTVLA